MYEPPASFNALSETERAQLQRLLRKLAAADPVLAAKADADTGVRRLQAT
jgi:hypothetical protein